MRVHTHAHKEKLFRNGKQFLRQKQAKFSNKLSPLPPRKTIHRKELREIITFLPLPLEMLQQGNEG